MPNLSDTEQQWYATGPDDPAYLSEADYLTARKSLYDYEWRAILHNKWIFANFYGRLGLTIPRHFGFVHPVSGRSLEGDPLREARDVAAYMDRCGMEGVALKHVTGGQGHHVYLLERRTGDGFLGVDGSFYGFADLDSSLRVELGGGSGMVLQELLSTHPDVTKLCDGDPNKVRLITLLRRDGDPIVQMAAARLGRRGAMTDNLQFEPVAAAVDLATGTLQEGRLGHATPRSETITTHPDTGVTFTGVGLPDWEETVELALAAARWSPNLCSVAWDIRLTQDGPVVIEGNLGWSARPLQVSHGGFLRPGGPAQVWREEWGVPLPG